MKHKEWKRFIPYAYAYVALLSLMLMLMLMSLVRTRLKRAELPDVNINTDAQSYVLSGFCIYVMHVVVLAVE